MNKHSLRVIMSRKLIVVVTYLALFLYACGSDKAIDPDVPTPADRDKFVGNWAGSYMCGNPMPDTLIIATGSGVLAFTITLHAQVFNADVVAGELTEINLITIPRQTLGGFPGSANIRYSNNTLSLSQTGFGITCQGTNYQRF